LLKVLRGQPAIRGKPTVLASQISALSQDRPVEQTRDALEQLAADGVIERWHVVLCREGSHWLAVSESPDEIKAFVATKVACPHCGRRVSEEKSDVAYCMSEDGQSYLSQKRWLCDLVETTLRRLGVEAVTVQPGGFTGWHSHPGPAIVVVQQGTFTYYDGEDPQCTPFPYGPGESFVDIGQGHVHSARNEGTEVVQVYVMYFDVPADVTNPFIPAAAPEFCDF